MVGTDRAPGGQFLEGLELGVGLGIGRPLADVLWGEREPRERDIRDTERSAPRSRRP